MVKISEQGLANLAPALAKFQAEVKNPSNSATNPQFRSKYAPLDVVINTAKPILAKHGLSVIQSTGSVEESIVVTTLLLHESGEFIESDPLVLPAYQLKSGGVKDFNAQGAGSAITYGRRYSLSAILGLSSEDDDDGNGASERSGNSGYKDSTSNKKKEDKAPNKSGAGAPSGDNKPSGGLSDEEREKRRQEAIKKAQERSKAPTPEPEAKPEPEATPAVESEPAEEKEALVSPAQLKAISNLLNVLSRKKDETFDKDLFLSTILAGFGVDALEEVTSVQAKDVIGAINAEMRIK